MRLFVFVFSLFVFEAMSAQNVDILKADSLFSREQYTQAQEAYEALYENDEVSASMLLKMAFIQEAIGDYSETLFFLNQYYQLTADRSVITKIEELASDKNLSGYRYDDGDYFLALINIYRIQIILSLSALLLLSAAYIVSKSRNGGRAYGTFVMQVALSVSLLFLINLPEAAEGIVVMDQTLLKSGPSAAAEPLRIIQKGHKVKIIEQNSVWMKIWWEGEEAYVRNNRVKII